MARNNRQLKLVFEPTGGLSEEVGGTITLKTSVPGYEQFTLNVAGQIRPPVQAFPGVVNLSGDSECCVTLVSRVNQPFRIVDVDCETDAISCRYESDTEQMEQQIFFRKSGDISLQSMDVKCQFSDYSSVENIPLRIFQQ